MKKIPLLIISVLLIVSCSEETVVVVLPEGDPANKTNGLSTFRVELDITGEHEGFFKSVGFYSTSPIEPLVDFITNEEVSTSLDEEVLYNTSQFRLKTPKPVGEIQVQLQAMPKVYYGPEPLQEHHKLTHRNKEYMQMKYKLTVYRDDEIVHQEEYNMNTDETLLTEGFEFQGL